MQYMPCKYVLHKVDPIIYDVSAGRPYTELLEIVKDKDYFVLTTNIDHQFQKAGFDKM